MGYHDMTTTHAGMTPIASGVQTLPIYDAPSLTKGGIMAHIRLDEQVYTLRITRAGKLILTK